MTLKLHKHLCFYFLFIATLSAIEKPNFDFNKWFYLITPFTGEGSNANQIPFRLFQSKDQNIIVHSGNKSFAGKGKGFGTEFLAFNKNWQLLYIGFHFPWYKNSDSIIFYDNFQNIQTKVTGQIFSLRYKFENQKIEPFFGVSYFEGYGPHDHSVINNFILYSNFTNEFIQIPKVDVKVYVEDPNISMGMSFKIPIQNWRLETIYSYAGERVYTNLVTSYARNIPFNEVISEFNNLYSFDINSENAILPIHYTIRKKYFSHRLGISLYMDYRRFISLRLSFKRDVTFNRWISNAMFNIILSQHFGLSFFYEYSERSVGTIRYWLVGPTFVFQL